MSKIDKLLSSQSWQASVRVVEDFLKSNDKLDSLLNRHAGSLEREISRRVQYLSFGVVRNLGRLQWALGSAVKKPPKKRLQAMLLLSMFEWMDAEDAKRPLVVHHAVEQAKRKLSKAEGRFVNAVMRRIPDLGLDADVSNSALEDWSSQYSHPQWMVTRWIRQFGEEATRHLLDWNQSNSKTYTWSPVSKTAVPGDWLETDWPEFYNIQSANWELVRSMLAEGSTYIQDPSTCIGPALFKELNVCSILDLCAAPGGKSIQLQRYISGSEGLLVSVDLEGPRFNRLKENLARYQVEGVEKIQVSADVLNLEAKDLPRAEYDAVYVDVPCSNTGVIQRRPDVKWRQKESGLSELADLQAALLRKSAEFVKLDGFLVYSTCSLDAAENEAVIKSFLDSSGSSFSQEKAVSSLPWESGHDGAGAFLLKRIK